MTLETTLAQLKLMVPLEDRTSEAIFEAAMRLPGVGSDLANILVEMLLDAT